MAVTANEEFARQMLLLSGSAEKFEPSATYDSDGDCIEFIAKPDPFFAERVDDLVTVYYSQDSGEVSGSLIKGVSKFCQDVLRRFPGFRIEIQDGRVKLVHIFRARLWTTESDPKGMVTLTYRKLIEVAEEAAVEIDGDLCLT